MKYKVGDKVKIKSRKEIENLIEITDSMLEKCGTVMTIKSCLLSCNSYLLSEDHPQNFLWSDEMIEGLVEEETKPKYEDEVTGEYYSTPKYLVRPYGYQFVDENGNVINAMKIVLEKKKKKKEYPKTYKECAEIIAELTGSDFNPKGCMGYMSVQLTALQKLLICRDAYWKIAGEEMGLGKPWEPDWYGGSLYFYYYNPQRDEFVKSHYSQGGSANSAFVFPTEEMRDAFKKNFDPDIEICKEFL